MEEHKNILELQVMVILNTHLVILLIFNLIVLEGLQVYYCNIVTAVPIHIIEKVAPVAQMAVMVAVQVLLIEIE